MGERKAEEFEDDRRKWKIYFDFEADDPMSNGVLAVRFRKNKTVSPYLAEEDIKRLKQDLKDLGKFRIIKQGKDFLENGKLL